MCGDSMPRFCTACASRPDLLPAGLRPALPVLPISRSVQKKGGPEPTLFSCYCAGVRWDPGARSLELEADLRLDGPIVVATDRAVRLAILRGGRRAEAGVPRSQTGRTEYRSTAPGA